MCGPLMKLYQADWCPYCRRVQKKLMELGIPYTPVEVLRPKEMRDELFEISGQRGIPALIDGGVIIADDDEAIIAYLEGRYGKTPIATGKKLFKRLLGVLWNGKETYGDIKGS